MLFDLSQVDYGYPDGTLALENISLAIPERASLAILGANGSGKSTLLRILSGLHFPARGEVRFRNRLLTERALEDPGFCQTFRSEVGFVFQNADAQLFNATVYDEVAFGPTQLGLGEDLVASRARETLEFLGIAHLAERPPFRLSGGEKRKAAIASVLSMNPSVLLFDEPFLALDPRGQHWLVCTMRRLRAAGKTIIVATHTMGLVPDVAETAIVLTEGHHVAFAGATEDLFRDEALLQDANLVGVT